MSLRSPRARHALVYSALFILTVALVATFALRTSRKANDDAAKAAAPAQQSEPERAAAGTRPESRSENMQEAAPAPKPEAEPEAKPEKREAREALRAKKGRGEVTVDLDNETGLKREGEEEAEREGRSADPDRPQRRTAPVATSRAAQDGEAKDMTSKGSSRQQAESNAQSEDRAGSAKHGPREERLRRGRTFDGDLRNLPYVRPTRSERPEREEPLPNPTVRQGAPGTKAEPSAQVETVPPVAALPAPAPLNSFDGLDFANWGAGHPPDTVGDVGPTYYIQAVNSSVGIFRKSDGVRVAAFTFNTFMSQGAQGNLCDTNNFGDPVILYDTFEDRWVITDFAFKLDAGNNVVNPPGAFQCFAVSKTGDPLTGGWNFYSINTAGGLGDYPKFGIWPDGLYMTVSMFGYPNGALFQNPRAYAFNKAQMYAGAPTVQVVSFDLPSGDFTVLPSNARLQTGTPPPGTPNYYVSTWQFTNALSVYKFHVDWDRISLSTFSAPVTPLAAASWPNASVPNAPSLGGNSLDVLQIRAMMQNQYTNLGGVESLWNTHTVRRANTSGFAAPRWYQLDVTGGTVAANITQAATWDPDGANVIHRFMPSLAVDRAGNMALGYSTSSSTTLPAIKYAGRLATDPVNTFSQTEQLLIQGTGTQTGNCGGAACTRWGDYSAMSLDPNGCTFWYTNMYYATNGLNDLTRIGSFTYPSCTPVGAGGTVSGTVTDNSANPIVGATVSFGSRSTTTDGSGLYSFTSIPAGTYPSITASAAGYNSGTMTSVVVADGGTTAENFTLNAAATSACLVDTTQADLQTGVPTNVEMITSPGDVKLSDSSSQMADQSSAPASLFIAGNLTGTNWVGQTFRAGTTGNLTRFDTLLGITGGSSGTITVEIRDLNGSAPGNNVLATGTIGPVTNVNNAAPYTATFATPAAVVAGTSYSVVLRTSVGSTVFAVRGSGSSYANGALFTTSTSGGSWSSTSNDLYFTTFVTTPFAYFANGNLVSGLKDANPAGGLTPTWSTLSWTATTPANTSVNFQVAGSNNAGGPFNFVGPDGTAGTFFTTSGASLDQFYGMRYLKYKAYLATSNAAATPTLSDVTVCYADLDCSAPVALTPSPAQVAQNSTGNTASGPAGETSYSWSITNGTITGGQTSQTVTYTAGASGTVGLTLNVVEPAGCHKSGGANVPILPSLYAQDAKVARPSTGSSVMLFTVALSSAATQTTTVDFATANGGATPATGGASCDGTVDYVTTSGPLSFATGEQVKTVAVTVCSVNVPGTDETFLLNLSNPLNATIQDSQAVGTITTTNTPSPFLISELRTSGPAGAGDQFVEFYNNTDSPLTVAASDASGGYGVYKMGASCADTPVLIGTIPNGTIIPARGHYLLVGSQYSLANYGGTGAAAGNQTMTVDIESDRNVAVFSTASVTNISTATRLDAVGFGSHVNVSGPTKAAASRKGVRAEVLSTETVVSNTGGVCDLMREGTTLESQSSSVKEHSFFRKECDFVGGVGCSTPGNPKDTNDNAADFQYADTTPDSTHRLGAPGPENLASPIRRDNSGIGLPYLDGSLPSSAVPNRVRTFSDPDPNSTFGTLSIRRRVTNNTGSTVTRLRFRIIEMTTFPSPAGTADLRARTSANVVLSGINDFNTCASTGTPTSPPCQVTAQGTTLETPPNQTNGGGVNSTLSVSIPGGLANGASLDVNFLLGIQQTGTFRFLLVIEALP